MKLTEHFDPSMAGAWLYAKSNKAQVTNRITGDFGTFDNVPKGYYVVLTGIYFVGEDYWSYLQTEDGWYAVINLYNGDQDLWEIKNAKEGNKNYQSNAQACVKKIINNNIIITQNNLVCARYASRFSPEQQQLIRDLQNRVVVRNNALIDSGFCENVQTSYPRGYAELEPYLAALMNGQAIGLATWAICVIAASVILVTSTAAYFAYRAFANESESDVKYSKELTKTLTEKLTEEEYQQLLNETKGIVTKSRLKQAISSYGNIAKWALFGIAGFAIYKVIMNKWKGTRE